MLTSTVSRLSSKVSYQDLGKKLDDKITDVRPKAADYNFRSNRIKGYIANGDIKLNFSGERKLQDLVDGENAVVRNNSLSRKSFLWCLGFGAVSYLTFPVHYYDPHFICIAAGASSILCFGATIGLKDGTLDIASKNKEIYDNICETYATDNIEKLLKDSIKQGRSEK